jgi:olefin beta-lactone synthetase
MLEMKSFPSYGTFSRRTAGREKTMANERIVNIASYLPAMAALKPHTPAVVFPHGRDAAGRVSYTHLTLAQLNERSDMIARGLETLGIRRGMRTVLMVTPSLDFFALTFALFKMGAVPVLIDPGIGIRSIGTCIGEAEPEAFIGITKAHIARIMLGWGKKTLKVIVTVGKRLFWGGPDLDDIISGGSGGIYGIAETGPDDMAAILFTSGSTGTSKGALYTHGIFDAQVRFIRDIYGIEPGEMDLSTFPLFALFGPALGMTAIIPDMDATKPAHADPAKLFRHIHDFGATNMFASPALINRLGRYGVERGIGLPSLKRVISAGAPARPEALERFSRMLGGEAQIFTPYGATEALPVCTIGSREILGEAGKLTAEGKGVCIGLPVPGITLHLIKITDTPIREWSDDLLVPDGEIGEIAVKGEIVTAGYYNRRDATELAKIPEGDRGEFYHRMGDVGYRDARGRIWFCGRKAQRVATFDGRTLFTIPCEGIFNSHPKVFRTALVGVGSRPVVCVEPEKGTKPEEYPQIVQELRALGAVHSHTASIDTFLFHPSFPVDIRHNAKIFREKLALWARRRIP